ncbi:hypothetical protein CEXT_259471 [Caerostris extrusa]|uniref:Uncharacterized protein n=1 Tax=Caerostris extrusa TaxID=172846 RepID=A0AAV4WDT8_CAEEX|nr:hypothetical protein CEXT_259471 [Caerostris extrusa]
MLPRVGQERTEFRNSPGSVEQVGCSSASSSSHSKSAVSCQRSDACFKVPTGRDHEQNNLYKIRDKDVCFATKMNI